MKNGKPVIYSYEYKYVMGWYGGWNWYRQKLGARHFGKAYVYDRNLRKVFGEKYYNVDLQAEIKRANQPISFVGLLDNLKNLPPIEYLLKLGLCRLAYEANKEDLLPGRDFASILGVSKQYLPLYQKYNIAPYEHKIIRSSVVCS